MYELSVGKLAGLKIHLVGAKGTGVCALAELLVSANAIVSGSDVNDIFYTDEVLKSIGVPVSSFSEKNVDSSIDLVIYSAAYTPEKNPELAKAKALGIPTMSYPEALGAFSVARDSSGICGVHGKTTTTAITGNLVKALNLPASVLAGSAVSNFGNRSTISLGHELFIAETCEYRRHFLNFKPRRIVLTSVESDHQDYYPDYEAIVSGFMDYILSLPQNGTVIYCLDHPGAKDVVSRCMKQRSDLKFVSYGFTAPGPYHIEYYKVENERGLFKLRAFDNEWELQIPGQHIALDSAAAIALCATIVKDRESRDLTSIEVEKMNKALASFNGSKRRSEVIGRKNDILFMDDYAHHPGELKATISGLRAFYPKRRIIVDFMSHTYTRTAALLDDFASSFSDADLVVLHKIYPSARETINTNVTGQVLFEKVKQNGVNAIYFEEVMDAYPYLMQNLKSGDLFITMGAGDNWTVGKKVYDDLK